MQTLQDMLTVEDFDVSDAFQHSRSTESIKSLASESYMSKMNVAKRRSNQQETETFYFSVGGTSPVDCQNKNFHSFQERNEIGGAARVFGELNCFSLTGVPLN